MAGSPSTYRWDLLSTCRWFSPSCLSYPLLPTIRSLNPTALFVWMSRFVATAFPLTLSLSHKGRGNPRTASSYKCKPLWAVAAVGQEETNPQAAGGDLWLVHRGV